MRKKHAFLGGGRGDFGGVGLFYLPPSLPTLLPPSVFFPVRGRFPGRVSMLLERDGGGGGGGTGVVGMGGDVVW